MDKYSPYLNWICGEQDSMRDLLMNLVNINSWSCNPRGLEKVMYLLSRETAKLGTLGSQAILDLPPYKKVDAMGSVEDIQLGPALHATKRPGAPIKIFLCIHADTVYHSGNTPQKAEVVNKNTMRGPGTADAKGGIVVMLKALQALERSPWASNIGWEVLINPDEEIGGVGSLTLLEGAAKRNHFGLLFEPVLPDGSMVKSRNGSLNYAIKFIGKSAHAGRPELGINAVDAAAYFNRKLKKYGKQLLPHNTTTNVAKIDGGGPNNVVPDLAIVRFNIRMVQKQDIQKIKNGINKILSWTRASEGVKTEIVSEHQQLPKEFDDKTSKLISRITECGEELGLKLHWEHSGGLSDGNRLAAHGLPCVDSLGVRGDNIHSPEELIYLDSMVERAKLTALFIMKIASGEIVIDK